MTAQLIGTPHYISPEQIRDARGVTGATDVYSLGVMLFELLCGSLPFTENSFGALCAAHLYEPPPDVRTLAADVPPELAALVARCLSKDAAARPTAAALATELTAIADALHAGRAESYADRPPSSASLGHLPTLAVSGDSAR
jgi:serine/threonine-protein kinase